MGTYNTLLANFRCGVETKEAFLCDWKPVCCCVHLYRAMASSKSVPPLWKADFTVCLQLSFSKDGEALRKFLQFDTGVTILCEQMTEKVLELSVVCCCEL